MAIDAAVTGMGICSPIGHDLDQVLNALEQGRSGIREIQSFDCTQLTMKHAGEVTEVPVPETVDTDRYYHWDRGTRMAIYAASQAFQNSGLHQSDIPSHRIGVVIGTSGSGQYQNARFQLNRSLRFDRELMFYLSRNAPTFKALRSPRSGTAWTQLSHWCGNRRGRHCTRGRVELVTQWACRCRPRGWQ